MANYNIELEEVLSNIKAKKQKPTLLLHTCCAPCSVHVLERLHDFFKITVFYFNPNIYPQTEFEKREQEQDRLLKTAYLGIKMQKSEYDTTEFFDAISGFETSLEGGERCQICIKLRLEKTRDMANKIESDFFGTTLSVSPYKNSKFINEVGHSLGVRPVDEFCNLRVSSGAACEEQKTGIISPTLAQEKGAKFLCADFKKKDGWKRSIELSREFNLYRQQYCGCVFSKMAAKERLRGALN